MYCFHIVASIVGKEHSKHMKLSSFLARFFWFGLDYSESYVFFGKQNMTWKKLLFWKR